MRAMSAGRGRRTLAQHRCATHDDELWWLDAGAIPDGSLLEYSFQIL